MITKGLGSLLAVAAIASAASRPDMLVSTDWLARHSTDAKVVILHVAADRTAYDAGLFRERASWPCLNWP